MSDQIDKQGYRWEQATEQTERVTRCFGRIYIGEDYLSWIGSELGERIVALLNQTVQQQQAAPAVGTWPWAFAQYKAGRDVERRDYEAAYMWGTRDYVSCLDAEDFEATDWQVVESEEQV